MKIALWCMLWYILSITPQQTHGQGILPTHRYVSKQKKIPDINILDKEPLTASFGFSLRRMRSNYKGPAVRIRRSTDSAEADVDFDTANFQVTNNSIVTIVVARSGLPVGSKLSYSTFAGATTLYVSIWYDQTIPAYDAVQTNPVLQPRLALFTSGANNTKASILFSGTQYLRIAQPPATILESTGRYGSLLLWTRPLTDGNNCAFGFERDPASSRDWRWAAIINASNGNLYFDAAELCCLSNRNVVNSVRLNFYNQYSFTRGNQYKTVRIAGVGLLNAGPLTAITAQTVMPAFLIGWGLKIAPVADASPYQGNISEIIMYPADLSAASLQTLEQNQISFWSS